jgi:hypothetical protein
MNAELIELINKQINFNLEMIHQNYNSTDKKIDIEFETGYEYGLIAGLKHSNQQLKEIIDLINYSKLLKSLL